MSKLTYTALDFETSGLDPEVDLPVEVCAVRVVEGEPIATFNALIQYPEHMPWTEALEKGHHNREDLRKGMPDSQAARILHFMMAGSMLVAYNALFDLAFLRAMYIRNFGNDAGLAHTLTVIDPCTISRDRDTYPHKLVDACRRRGIDIGEAHLALDDTLGLVDLTNRMHEEQDITPYINAIGYQRQYGVPKYAHWLPPHIALRPQGKETFYHHAEGTTTRQTFIGKPYQRVVMGKPIAPENTPEPAIAAPRPLPPTPQAQQAWGQMTGGQPFPQQTSDKVFREAIRRPLVPPPPPGN